MRVVFRGWNRKIGAATLLMACAFMVGWVRSESRFEYVFFISGAVDYGIVSMHGGVDFCRTSALDNSTKLKQFDFKSVELSVNPQDPFSGTPWSAQHVIEWRWDWAGFHLGESRLTNRQDQDCMIPYWALVLPLTLLSAYLLLSKPRKPAPVDSMVTAIARP